MANESSDRMIIIQCAASFEILYYSNFWTSRLEYGFRNFTHSCQSTKYCEIDSDQMVCFHNFQVSDHLLSLVLKLSDTSLTWVIWPMVCRVCLPEYDLSMT